MKLLVVEDDPSVCEMLRLFFEKEQYDATFIHNGLTAQHYIRDSDWDFIILDWMLPGKDGIALCREVRQTKQTPVILLTAKDQENDRILGLELGADDYVTKPFSPMELIARMKAVLRRYHLHPASASAAGVGVQEEEFSKDDLLQYNRIAINIAARSITIDGQPVSSLTPKEFELFRLFVKHPKKVFTREQLLESVWGYDYFGEERTVDVHIKRLRNKVSRPERQLIVTVWGVGYKLEE
ncbi:response regulator transcription factor [Paenibacillus thalictri]|uniref:Response regulator transcription factor n=1 Tax=Paenibacillus thalictri TaxID=2527873 RepID=A0A4Q9DPP0_9BACL|nr:response regulator transcription factor [Paenibacillus thalictri]TBL76278.1 response regulator transcription factor [Paenibacillus thalictri]